MRSLRRPLFDIPPRIRSIVVVLGLAGIIAVVVGSLESAGGSHVKVDKLLHFGGYAVLSTLFVVGLPWKLYVPALLGLLAMGAGIEFLQPLTGRSFDMSDQLANSTGVATGAGIGFVIRVVLAWIRTETVEADERRRTVRFPEGAVVFRQGDPSDDLYLVREGRLRLTRTAGGEEELLEEVGKGDVVGEMGVIQREPRYATATALTSVALYRVDVQRLAATCGGEGAIRAVVQGLARRLEEANERLEAQRTRPA